MVRDMDEKYEAVWELRVACKDHTDHEFAALLTRMGVADADTLVREARLMAYQHLI